MAKVQTLPLKTKELKTINPVLSILFSFQSVFEGNMVSKQEATSIFPQGNGNQIIFFLFFLNRRRFHLVHYFPGHAILIGNTII